MWLWQRGKFPIYLSKHPFRVRLFFPRFCVLAGVRRKGLGVCISRILATFMFQRQTSFLLRFVLLLFSSFPTSCAFLYINAPRSRLAEGVLCHVLLAGVLGYTTRHGPVSDGKDSETSGGGPIAVVLYFQHTTY